MTPTERLVAAKKVLADAPADETFTLAQARHMAAQTQLLVGLLEHLTTQPEPEYDVPARRSFREWLLG